MSILPVVLSLILAQSAFAEAATDDYDPLQVGEFLAPLFAEKQVSSSGTISLANLKGKVVLLNFWATWCEPCREETPLLVRLKDEYPTARNRGRRRVFQGCRRPQVPVGLSG